MEQTNERTSNAPRLLKIRFNTAYEQGGLPWRIITEGKEVTASGININVPTFDTRDVMEGGLVKFHIACYYSTLEWQGDHLTVN